MNIFRQAAALPAALAKDGQPWRQSRGTRWGDKEQGGDILASHGSFPGDQVMPAKDLQTLTWDLPGTLVFSSLFHETTFYL